MKSNEEPSWHLISLGIKTPVAKLAGSTGIDKIIFGFIKPEVVS